MKNIHSFKSHSLRIRFYKLKDNTPLSSLLLNTTEEWYKEKHRRFSVDEIKLINSLAISSCPFCGSNSFKKDGKRKDGTQTFKCNDCGRKFNPLTGTVFDSRKIPLSEWIEYLIHVSQYESITESALDNRNVESTGKYWLKRYFLY